MPSPNEIELPFNLLATFGSQLLSPLWLTIILGVIVSFIVMMFLSKWPRSKFKYTWLTTFGVPLLVGVLAFFFIPQQPRPGIPGEKVASSDPVITLHGDNRHDKVQYNFFCGDGGILQSDGSNNDTEVDHNTRMANCPWAPGASAASRPPAAAASRPPAAE